MVRSGRRFHSEGGDAAVLSRKRDIEPTPKHKGKLSHLQNEINLREWGYTKPEDFGCVGSSRWRTRSPVMIKRFIDLIP